MNKIIIIILKLKAFFCYLLSNFSHDLLSENYSHEYHIIFVYLKIAVNVKIIEIFLLLVKTESLYFLRGKRVEMLAN